MKFIFPFHINYIRRIPHRVNAQSSISLVFMPFQIFSQQTIHNLIHTIFTQVTFENFRVNKFINFI
ncbi:hypothetical protein DB771_14340 [Burkholderia sp. AU29985]|nr:hypothetical protein XM57_08525 [Burkholderia cepacia]AYZ97737.1 hypothetical protein EGY28_22485 [Burkholderia dolosa]ETP66786.1 hypothetical protein BDSB_05145 [Burkholderia dolosa PC543]PRE44825.1 hypothetical protein C6P87_22745 [Burkholderia sp. AU12872]PUA76212.1 hypothetical protein DB771_14340 [Burkholderia sp. AU29985]